MTNGKSQLRVLLVSHSSALTGSSISCYNLAARLRDEGIEPHYACAVPGPVCEWLEALDIPAVVIPNGLFGLKATHSFERLIESSRIDVVHLNCLLDYYKYAGLAAKTLHRPVIWFVREDPRSERSKRLFTPLKSMADRIITVSEDTMVNLFPDARPANTQVIHNGVDLTKFRPKQSSYIQNLLQISSDIPLIGCAATLERRKGIHVLVEAASLLKRRGVPFRLVILGRDRTTGQRYSKSIKRSVIRLGIEDRVWFLPPQEAMDEVMNSFDIYVLASFWEGLSRTLLEATACSRPVVATDAGGNREVVRHGVNGLLVPPGDPTALADALAMLIANRDRRREMGDRGRMIAEEGFGIERHVESVASAYRRLTMAA